MSDLPTAPFYCVIESRKKMNSMESTIYVKRVQRRVGGGAVRMETRHLSSKAYQYSSSDFGIKIPCSICFSSSQLSRTKLYVSDPIVMCDKIVDEIAIWLVPPFAALPDIVSA